ncbi:hypothetical protein FBU30_010023 [Linnemannia zychae]|nr:hypothetical protein FBU30_010023 [Linnemannia zychae]
MPPRDRQNDSISLYVSGFKDSTRPSDLATLFEPHGRIADVYIPKDYYSGLPRGFAYIQYGWRRKEMEDDVVSNT